MATISLTGYCGGVRRLNCRIRAIRWSASSRSPPPPTPLPGSSFPFYPDTRPLSSDTPFTTSTTTAATASLPTTPSDVSDAHRKKSSAPASFFPKKGQTLELECESLGYKAKGICKPLGSNFILMCDRALPGERFRGLVTRKKSSYAEVKKLETIVPHWDAVDAPCQYASDCGGCKTQSLLYDAQTRYKEAQVYDLVVHVGKFSMSEFESRGVLKPIVPCSLQFHYRNKMEFSFSDKKWLSEVDLAGKDKGEDLNGFALGLHAPGFFDKVLQIDKCLLQTEAANKVLAAIQARWKDQQLGLSPYNVHSHNGFLKHLMLRSGRDVKTGLPEIMVNFVTSSYKPELLAPLVDEITAFPEVASVVNNVNSSVGNTSVGEDEYTLYGKSAITETLRGLIFRISANSFFQTNTHQAEVLYKLIEEYARLKGDRSEIILDLFCGTGTIGLTLARMVNHVYGYEIVAEAVSDARHNAAVNDINNATFIQGDLNKIGNDFGSNFPKPDVVITDPNRPGMHMKLIRFLLQLRAPRIVYVSCNPATCARDLDYLCHGITEKGLSGCYKLKSLHPVDMFPHTPHIECVCLLELN